MWIRSISLSLAMLLLSAVMVLAAGTGKPVREIRWDGEIHLERSVSVATGEVLSIAPGSVVRILTPDIKIDVYGEIAASGTATEPVVFYAPLGWKGIELHEGVTVSRFVFTEINGAEIAISSTGANFSISHGTFRACGTAIRLLRESTPLIEGSLFVDNTIGIDSEMKSSATIRRNHFRGHKKTAILLSHNSSGLIEKNRFEQNQLGIDVLQNAPGRITDNRFLGNRTAIHCFQTQSTPDIRGNRFDDNESAIDNSSFSSPPMDDNTFVGNTIAIHNDQLGNGPIRRNLFRNNRTAIFNNRKSSPFIEHNLIEQNDLAIYCDYSSYPRVHHNNFRKNGMAVKLGKYQSGDWERRVGANAPARREASEQGKRNPQVAKAMAEIRDEVDVSNNWWGEDTFRLKLAGAAGNLAMFHDRHDQPLVVYEGFGPEHYALDKIRFAPWLTVQVPGSGPQVQVTTR